MKVFIFDTETTGLYNKTEKDISKQPYIVQFSGILVDMQKNGEYNEIDRVDILIKPPILIPYITSTIHGIYDIDVMDKKPFSQLYAEIMPYINNVDIIVGHNIDFDINVLKVEISRLKTQGIPIDFYPQRIICTMKESIDFCAIPKKSGNGYKRPKLQELTKRTIGKYFHGAHNAMVDVEYTLKAFKVLVEKGIISLEGKKEMTLF